MKLAIVTTTAFVGRVKAKEEMVQFYVQVCDDNIYAAFGHGPRRRKAKIAVWPQMDARLVGAQKLIWLNFFIISKLRQISMCLED